MYDETLEIDYQLVGEGVIVTDDYLALIMDGTFHSVREGYHEDDEKPQYMSPMPYHRNDRGPAQVMISDYTMQSMINASLDLNWFDFTKIIKAN